MTGSEARPYRRIVWFFVLAYAIGWGVEGFLRVQASQAGLDPNVLREAAETHQFELLQGISISPWVAYALTRCQDFAFTLSALVLMLTARQWDELRVLGRRFLQWRVSWLAYGVALLPIVFYLIAVFVAELQTGNTLASFDWGPDTAWKVLFSAQAGLVVTLLTRGPMGEEAGLRGFAQVQLQRRIRPFRTSILIGLGWGLWHLPALIARGPIVLVLYLLVVLCLTFLFTWLFHFSRGSLIPVLILHTLQNSEDVLEVLFPALIETDWELPSTVLILLAGACAGVALWKRGATDETAEVEMAPAQER